MISEEQFLKFWNLESLQVYVGDDWELAVTLVMVIYLVVAIQPATRLN